MEEKIKHLEDVNNNQFKMIDTIEKQNFKLQQQNKQLQEENEGLRLTIKNDDTVVHNLIKQNKQLHTKLVKQNKQRAQLTNIIREYINTYSHTPTKDYTTLLSKCLLIIESESE